MRSLGGCSLVLVELLHTVKQLVTHTHKKSVYCGNDSGTTLSRKTDDASDNNYNMHT